MYTVRHTTTTHHPLCTASAEARRCLREPDAMGSVIKATERVHMRNEASATMDHVELHSLMVVALTSHHSHNPPSDVNITMRNASTIARHSLSWAAHLPVDVTALK
eukprot:Blabericola_migrator_1__5513@NODE_2811_length_2328_cov_5_685980_g1761_i0_p2_GENE_NODE_2811_length_2328_cov_5_685980_g1761_i0NODE_2811_length_2328_cov_5_685980_g1761_i0_p2_ORF_typecomplete_len106_score9_06_NODE_2811_length_2328_cov_5_685980_g1761_i0216533